MKNKRYAKEGKRYIGKLAISLIVVAVIAVGSFVTVMANTVPCVVADGDKTYTFSLLNPALSNIVEKAVAEGMPALGAEDKVFMDEEHGEVRVERAIPVSISFGNTFSQAYVYQGDTVATALEKANVSPASRDKVEPALESKIEAATEITVTPFTGVSITADGKTQKAELYGGTVADAIQSVKITLQKGDKIKPAAETALTNGMTVQVVRENTIKITDAGQQKTHKTFATTLRTALRELGYTVGKADRLSHPEKTPLVDGLEITILRQTQKDVTETETMLYDTTYEEDASLYESESYTKTAGVVGEKELTYRETYLGEERIDRTLQSERVRSEPINEVIVLGTRVYDEPASEEGDASNGTSGEASGGETGGAAEDDPSGENASGNSFVDYNGDTVSYASVMNGECTAYSDPGGITSLGGATQVGVVAVDPSIIPYGTRMYITSGSVVYGYCVAGDTGGAMLSGRVLVDVYYDTEEECNSFGRRDMTVYLLD